jgi:L-threonylcarbamoyladenylate synthase
VDQIHRAAQVIRKGGVIAYPTESCYGLGCDPDNIAAIKRILKIKKRSRDKGLILISDRIDRLLRYLEPLQIDRQIMILESWPGPVTWLWPARSGTSRWLKGEHDTLGVRVTAHPVAAKICRASGMPLVSTSANLAMRPPLRHSRIVNKVFSDKLDYVVEAAIGQQLQPSRIIHALTGEVIRP